MLVGGITFFANTVRPTVIAALVSCLLYGVSFRLPEIFGYCLSPRMPCNYGMVPAVRFVAVVGMLVMVVALIRLARSRKTSRP
jgi:hypothetical protein